MKDKVEEAVKPVTDNIDDKDKQATLTGAINDCVIDGCNAMKYQESEYCLRHQTSMVSKNEIEKLDSNDEGQQKWWNDCQ